MILTHDNGTIQDAIVILDESVKSKRSKQHLTAYLGRELNAGHAARKIREIRFHTSHTDNLVQAADMLTGAINARYHRGNGAYLDYIRVKISDLWEWRAETQ